MPAPGTFVIAGGGLAGAKAAEALRGQGFDGRIVLAAEEDARPCERLADPAVPLEEAVAR